MHHLPRISAAEIGQATDADRLQPSEHALAPEIDREHLCLLMPSDHREQLAVSAVKRARMLSNSRCSDWYCDSNSSSGMPGALNIVNE